MGMYVMLKAPCPKCGEVDGVELMEKAAPILCWYVRCPECGTETAKHRKAEDAIRDWNHLPREEKDD